MTYRKKTYVPNVLTFPIEKNMGDIFICTERLTIEAPKYKMSVRSYTAYLFIHGLLHLKGHGHGDTMEREEARHMKAFGF